MKNVSPPSPNGKTPSMAINKYRDLCRALIRDCKHPEVTWAGKQVLNKLVDYVNAEEGYTAWPAFDTLAEDVRADRSTVIRAINAGRKAGILERIYHGGKWRRGGKSNRYRFPIDPVSGVTPDQDDWDDDLVAHEPLGDDIPLQPSGTPALDLVARAPQLSGSPATQSSYLSSDDNLIRGVAPPSASPTERIDLEGKEGVGERSEPDYSEIKKAVLASWSSFSPTTLMKHMRIYGAAKTLEVVACAARLGRPDINKVLDTPLMEWSAPTVTEIEYTPLWRMGDRTEGVGHRMGNVPQNES